MKMMGLLIDFKLNRQYFNIRKLLIRINSYFIRKTKNKYKWLKIWPELGWDNKNKWVSEFNFLRFEVDLLIVFYLRFVMLNIQLRLFGSSLQVHFLRKNALRMFIKKVCHDLTEFFKINLPIVVGIKLLDDFLETQN